MNRERLTTTLRRYRQIAVVTVAGLCLLVVAGGIVRLTGSGLGCDDWPACNRESFVDVSSGHTAIEQVNRLLSGLIGVPVLLLVLAARRVRPRRAGLLGPSIAVLVSVLGNAVVGGVAVRGDLHPALVQSHFLLAMVSITFAMVVVHRSGPAPSGPAVIRGAASWLFVAVGTLTAVALATGTVVTGTGPHAGDEDARRWGFDISTVAMIHSGAVWATVAAMLALLVVLWRTGRYPRHASRLSAWIFVAAVQGAIGYMQYFNGVPELLVGAHLAGATALWVITVHLVLVALAPVGDDASVHEPVTRSAHGLPVAEAPKV
jgi:cytochrome c oxidase assembly protein subunit 15